MKLTIGKPPLTNLWVVDSLSVFGDRLEIYAGPDQEAGMATYLVAEALARAYPRGSGPTRLPYSELVEPLFDLEGADEAKDLVPFAWARRQWVGERPQQRIKGAELFWIDEHGAKLPVKVSLDARARAVVQSLKPGKGKPQAHSIHPTMAALQAWEMHEQVAGAKTPCSQRKASL